MSGLEVFLDGGATFASLLSAGAAVVGYRQQKEDDLELVEDMEEVEQLRKNLSEAATSAWAAHAALTAAWGQPLSLFRGPLGIPVMQVTWAVEVVEVAKELVEKAAEFEDLADVYDAQLQLAKSHGRSLLRSPLLRLEERLDELSLVLTSQIAAVVLAKEAFSLGDTSAVKPVHAMAAMKAATSFGQGSLKSMEELPLAILQDRQLLGELWRVGPGRMETLARAIARRRASPAPVAKEVPEYSPYVAEYL